MNKIKIAAKSMKVNVNGKKMQLEGVWKSGKKWMMKVSEGGHVTAFDMVGMNIGSGEMKPMTRKAVTEFNGVEIEVRSTQVKKWFANKKFYSEVKTHAGKKIVTRNLNMKEETKKVKLWGVDVFAYDWDNGPGHRRQYYATKWQAKAAEPHYEIGDEGRVA